MASAARGIIAANVVVETELAVVAATFAAGTAAEPPLKKNQGTVL